ncbi:unnamed protein product [Cochlearia groenlandica]
MRRSVSVPAVWSGGLTTAGTNNRNLPGASPPAATSSGFFHEFKGMRRSMSVPAVWSSGLTTAGTNNRNLPGASPPAASSSGFVAAGLLL